MIFDEDFVAQILSEVNFKVLYQTGFMLEEDEYSKNELEKWTLIKAKEKEMVIKLFFTKPVYVSSADIPCRLKLDFGDGATFKSAGYNIQLQADTTLTRDLVK